MKAGLATSLSIAGVLATGAAALALNSSILDTESSTKGAPALAAVVGTQTNGAVTELGGSDTAASASGVSADGAAEVVSASKTQEALIAPQSVSPETSTTSAEPSGPGATTPSSVEKQFKIEDVAVVTLIASEEKLTVKDVSITPGSDFRVGDRTSRDDDDVRITLISPTRTIEFSARLDDGRIMAAIGTPSSGNLNRPRPPHNDEDHYEDRYEDDDHREDDREVEDEDEEHHEREDRHDDDD